jgi:hypothetical protein
MFPFRNTYLHFSLHSWDFTTMPYPSQMNSYGMQHLLVSYPTTLLLYAFLQNAGNNWTSVNYAERKAKLRQASCE